MKEVVAIDSLKGSLSYMEEVNRMTAESVCCRRLDMIF